MTASDAERLTKLWDQGIVLACQREDANGHKCREPTIRGCRLCLAHDREARGLPPVAELSFQPRRKDDQRPPDDEGEEGHACFNASGSVAWVKANGKWVVMYGDPDAI